VGLVHIERLDDGYDEGVNAGAQGTEVGRREPVDLGGVSGVGTTICGELLLP
jgi:hypothetical protein